MSTVFSASCPFSGLQIPEMSLVIIIGTGKINLSKYDLPRNNSNLTNENDFKLHRSDVKCVSK